MKLNSCASQEVMESEINILLNSPLLGKGLKLKDIQKKFNIEIIHIHNPRIKDASVDINIDLNKEIKLGVGICFSGTPENVSKFLDFAFG